MYVSLAAGLRPTVEAYYAGAATQSVAVIELLRLVVQLAEQVEGVERGHRGQVDVAQCIDDRVLGDNQLVDPDLLDAVGRMGGLSYCRTTERFELGRP